MRGTNEPMKMSFINVRPCPIAQCRTIMFCHFGALCVSALRCYQWSCLFVCLLVGCELRCKSPSTKPKAPKFARFLTRWVYLCFEGAPRKRAPATNEREREREAPKAQLGRGSVSGRDGGPNSMGGIGSADDSHRMQQKTYRFGA